MKDFQGVLCVMRNSKGAIGPQGILRISSEVLADFRLTLESKGLGSQIIAENHANRDFRRKSDGAADFLQKPVSPIWFLPYSALPV